MTYLQYLISDSNKPALTSNAVGINFADEDVRLRVFRSAIAQSKTELLVFAFCSFQRHLLMVVNITELFHQYVH